MVRHRSPQIPDMAPGMHLDLQSIQYMYHRFNVTSSDCHIIYFLTPSIFVAEVRKPPHIAQADNISCHSQEKLQFIAPVSSFLHLCFLAFCCIFFIQHAQNFSQNPALLLTRCPGLLWLTFILNPISCKKQLPYVMRNCLTS